jgi:D-inositol-3-phosphate glycosyltransferase
VGPALDQSSYARVIEATLGPLAASWDIIQLAVNHRGAPVDAGWQILPNRTAGDRYGVTQIPPLVAEFAPHAVFVFNSFLNLPRYWELPALLGRHRPVLVSQCPVLGEAVDARLVGRHACFDCVVVLSDTVRGHFAESFASCRRSGWIDRAPSLEVIPHGLDAGLFHPLPDRRAARAAISTLADIADDGFVVLNANRNEPRKRIDVTLEGFARFARANPATCGSICTWARRRMGTVSPIKFVPSPSLTGWCWPRPNRVAIRGWTTWRSTASTTPATSD